MDNNAMSFEELVTAIRSVHDSLSAQASKAVNLSLTLRNWFIGGYISEYELAGADRADYGDKLFSVLSERLQEYKVSNSGRRQLYLYLSFYRTYPQIVRTASALFEDGLPGFMLEEKVRTASAQSILSAEKLINSLSYSHLEQLSVIEDVTKRQFYEIECIKGNWSVRELKRQIGSLYYERSGLSLDKAKLSTLANDNAEVVDRRLAIRDPYIFEFLGLKPQEVMGESDLQKQLLKKLQEFLLELGHGFCFEAENKRILIGDTHYYVDMVFYHRILKCHILIELKVESFTHENIGQLNTYVSWYKKNVMAEDDNPPIGILLCTQKDHTLVEYALAGMENNMFVSRYQLELPQKEEMQAFIEQQAKELAGK